MLDHRNAGSLAYISTVDGVRRVGSYQHLSQFPLTTLVALSEWGVQSSFRSQLIWNAGILVLVLTIVAAMGGRALKANRSLKSQAMQDGLTGLGNRRIFEETIQSEFRRAARSIEPLSVILIDIDHFKSLQRLLWPPRWRRMLAIDRARDTRLHPSRRGYGRSIWR